MSARTHAGSSASPTLAEQKSQLLAEALGDGYSVQVLDAETVEVSAHEHTICRISFEDEVKSPPERIRSRT